MKISHEIIFKTEMDSIFIFENLNAMKWEWNKMFQNIYFYA